MGESQLGVRGEGRSPPALAAWASEAGPMPARGSSLQRHRVAPEGMFTLILCGHSPDGAQLLWGQKEHL